MADCYTNFYNVDPSHVRKQLGSYGIGLSKLEERYKDEVDKVNEWRAALTLSADLSGWIKHQIR